MKTSIPGSPEQQSPNPDGGEVSSDKRSQKESVPEGDDRHGSDSGPPSPVPTGGVPPGASWLHGLIPDVKGIHRLTASEIAFERARSVEGLDDQGPSRDVGQP